MEVLLQQKEPLCCISPIARVLISTFIAFQVFLEPLDSISHEE